MPSIKKLLILSTILLFSTAVFSQTGNLVAIPHPDSALILKRQTSSIANLIVSELFIIGISYYASLPNAHGDKVVGWLYAGAAAATLIYAPFYWFNKENKPDRVWNIITILGLSYGFSRVATYNLLHSDGDPFHTRFTRNLLEIHAAYFVPIALGALTEKWINNHKKKRIQTSFSAGPGSIYIVCRF